MMDVGLIGFGLAGRCFHATVISAVPGLRLACIVQRSGDEAAQKYPGARIVRSVEELLSIDSIRLVVIATPNQTHFPLAVQCLEAGRDVVVDKPFAATLDEAVQLQRLAGKLGRLLTVYHNRRFDSDFQAVRAAVETGELGEIVRFETHYDRYRPVSKPNAWREKPGAGSGVLFDLGPHLLDHALALFGAPEAISADVRIERAGFVTDDAFDLTLHYGPRLRAQLSATMLSAAPRPRFVLLGTKGSFVKQSFDPLENSLRNGEVPTGQSWMIEREEGWGELTLVQDGTPRRKRIASHGDWREFYANVRDALLGKAQLLVTPEQALEVMKGLDLALESSKRRCAIPWKREA